GSVVGIVVLTETAITANDSISLHDALPIFTGPDSSVVYTETVAVCGDGSYSTTNAAVATQVGTYTWSASYSGDGLNNGAVDDGQDRQTPVVAASPAATSAAAPCGEERAAIL